MRTLSQQPPLFQRGAQAQARKKSHCKEWLFNFWWAPGESNPAPTDYESDKFVIYNH